MENRKYQPSSGSEGIWFCGNFCDRCANQHPDYNHPKQCMILCRTMCHNIKDKEYPEEWIYNDQDKPVCTAHVPWDWGRDDDGNWIEPPVAPPDDPNQLCMPFIFDEIGVKQIQSEIA